MTKVVGGDYQGYRVICTPQGLCLQKFSDKVRFTREEVEDVSVLDSKESTSGTRRAAKGFVYSAMGIGGLWGGLSAKSKREMLVSIRFTNGKACLISTDDKTYHSILKHVFH